MQNVLIVNMLFWISYFTTTKMQFFKFFVYYYNVYHFCISNIFSFSPFKYVSEVYFFKFWSLLRILLKIFISNLNLNSMRKMCVPLKWKCTTLQTFKFQNFGDTNYCFICRFKSLVLQTVTFRKNIHIWSLLQKCLKYSTISYFEAAKKLWI